MRCGSATRLPFVPIPIRNPGQVIFIWKSEEDGLLPVAPSAPGESICRAQMGVKMTEQTRLANLDTERLFVYTGTNERIRLSVRALVTVSIWRHFMGDTEKLSKRQQAILEYIGQYAQRHNRPPTIREIGEAVDISSTSVVTYNLNKLVEKDLVSREREVSRGLSLTNKAREKFNMARESVQSALMRIPIKGQIVAGEPINVGNDTFETFDEEDVVEVASSMLPKQQKDLFALRVSGESMIDAMVNDGDIVVMKQQQTAHNGDMVAVWLNSSDTTTLKYFFREDGRVRLQPANPQMKPIFVDADDVTVQGKVVMVLRQTP